MKKAIAISLIVFSAAFACGVMIGNRMVNKHNDYVMNGYVVAIEDNETTIRTLDGNEWVIIDDNYSVGEDVKVTLDTYKAFKVEDMTIKKVEKI